MVTVLVLIPAVECMSRVLVLVRVGRSLVWPVLLYRCILKLGLRVLMAVGDSLLVTRMIGPDTGIPDR